MKTFDDILGAKPINKWGLDFQLYWINVVFSKLASQSEAVFLFRVKRLKPLPRFAEDGSLSAKHSQFPVRKKACTFKRK